MPGVKGRSGRKKKPDAMHQLQNTHRADRHGKKKAATARPTKTKLEPPKCLKLSRTEKAVWREVVDLLGTVPDLVADIDKIALGSLCEAVAEFVQAREEIKKAGATCISDKGAPYQHPAVGRKNKALERIRYWVARFGMSPSDRASLDVSAAASGGTGNAFEQFIANQSRSN